MRPPETLADVLNKCEAIIEAKCASVKSLGKDIGEPLPRVSEWVTMRTVQPRGEITMKLHTWAAKKVEQISRTDSETQNRFRTAYRSVCEKRRN